MHPVLISLGRFQLSTYGVFVAAGYLLGILWLKTQMRAMGLDEKRFWNLIYALFFSAIVGSKLLFWAVYYRDIIDGRLSLIGDFRYGFVFFGGLGGALAAGWVMSRRLRLDVMALADFFAVALAFGHALGRLGCLAAGCCYGRPTALPWGLVLGGDPASITPPELWGVALHPTQVYESLANAVTGLFLLKVLLPRVKSGELRPGTVFLFYVLIYGAARFIIEFFRFDDRGASLQPFSISQWIALAAVGAALAAMARRGVRPR